MSGEQEIKKAYESILAHDFEQAIEWFEQAIALEPNNAAYHYKVSITCARSNKLAKAIEHAAMASRLHSTSEEYRFHLENLQAQHYVQLAEKTMRDSDDELDLAISFLKQAVCLDPLLVKGFLLLGIAYAELNDYSHAIQALEDAIKLDPLQEEAHKLLAQYRHKLNQYLRPN